MDQVKQYRRDWEALDDFTGTWIPAWCEGYDRQEIVNHIHWIRTVSHVRNARMSERDLSPWRPVEVK